jgi:hypothetical protein
MVYMVAIDAEVAAVAKAVVEAILAFSVDFAPLTFNNP